jgi:hypothetical protein
MPRTEKRKAKPSVPKKPKKKRGRKKITLTEGQKVAAVKYIASCGFWKYRLAAFLRIDHKTLDLILKRDKNFSLELEAANAEFCGKNIRKASPEFILHNKFSDEFPDTKKIDVEHSINEKLLQFLEQAKILTNERKRLSDGGAGNNQTS